jgi:hypothetical protein
MGKGCATVGVGPQSALGRIKAGRKVRSSWRCGAKTLGAAVQRGVRVERKAARVPGEDWRAGRVESTE